MKKMIEGKIGKYRTILMRAMEISSKCSVFLLFVPENGYSPLCKKTKMKIPNKFHMKEEV